MVEGNHKLTMVLQ